MRHKFAATHSDLTTRTARGLAKRRPLAALALLLAASVCAASAAGARVMASTQPDPMAVVRSTVNEVLRVLRDKSASTSERQAELRALVTATFDFTEMSRSAMGYHWRVLSPEQREEFTDVFTAFIQDSYLSRINDYSADDVTVNFLRVSFDGDQYAQVRTEIIQTGKQPVPINYRLLRRGNQWKIYDVTVDAISIIANYRNQFNRVMNNQGYATLISDLKSKQANIAATLGPN
jgi:phospholipid transport system substrate-binding protein